MHLQLQSARFPASRTERGFKMKVKRNWKRQDLERLNRTWECVFKRITIVKKGSEEHIRLVKKLKSLDKVEKEIREKLCMPSVDPCGNRKCWKGCNMEKNISERPKDCYLNEPIVLEESEL